MHVTDAIGKFSAAVGSLAVLLVIPVFYAKGLLGMGTSHVVFIADRLGLLAAALASAPTLMQASPSIPLTDESIVLTAFWYVNYLGAAAMLPAAYADARGEERIYLTAGFMTDLMTLFYANAIVGAAAMVAGVFTVPLLRQRSNSRPTPPK